MAEMRGSYSDSLYTLRIEMKIEIEIKIEIKIKIDKEF